jgi:hypothetical protein
LGDVLIFGRPGEISGSGDCAEIPQLMQFHELCGAPKRCDNLELWIP